MTVFFFRDSKIAAQQPEIGANNNWLQTVGHANDFPAIPYMLHVFLDESAENRWLPTHWRESHPV